MHIVIRGLGSSNSLYTPAALNREARQLARTAHLRYVRHWVEVEHDGSVRLRVETKRPDGLGEIINHVL